MGPLIMLYHIELFEYTLLQFCSRFTLILELEWPSSWDSKTGVLCEKNLLPTCVFGPSCDEYLSNCPLPIAPCPYTPIAPLYLTLHISSRKPRDTMPNLEKLWFSAASWFKVFEWSILAYFISLLFYNSKNQMINSIMILNWKPFYLLQSRWVILFNISFSCET